MLNCTRCGADYSEQGLDNGRCRQCGNIIAWSMTAVAPAAFPQPAPSRSAAPIPSPPAPSRTDSPALAPAPIAHDRDPPDTSSGVADQATAQRHQTDPRREPDATARTLPLHLLTVSDDHAAGNGDTAMSVQVQWAQHVGDGQNISLTIKTDTVDGTIPDHLVIPRRAVRSIKESAGLRNDYELIDVIGEGGEGIVHAARQASIDRTVALKMIRKDRTGESGARLKFLSEAVVTGDLEHPNIVPIYDLGTTNDGSLFYVMKRIQGTPWSQVIHRKTLHENLSILMRTADAVALAHSRGVVHRDLKPENVMLGDFGEILLTDWGIALCTDRFAKKDSVVLSRGLGGTPAYMAPEMATGPMEAIGPGADIYLLGAILFEIVAGKPPHHADDVMQCLVAAANNEIQSTDVTGELIDVARKAMVTNPAARYASVKDFQDAVAAYQSHCESVLLSEQANNDLQRARQSAAYDDFAAAVFGFQKAIDLWPQNHRARATLVIARVDYAAAALSKGDLDLALSLLDPKQVRHSNLIKKIGAAQRERDARQHRLRRLRRFAAILLIAIFAGGSYAFLKVSDAKRLADASARTAKIEAIRAKESAKKATEETLAAEQARMAEKEAKEAAVHASVLAAEQKVAALRAADIATAALQRAGEASYSSAIALAVNSIANNAFDDATAILVNQKNQPEQSPLRHWEWGRLMYLCLGGDPESPSGAAVQTLASDAEVLAVAVSASGNRIAAATMSGSVHLWQLDSQERAGDWNPVAVIAGDGAVHGVAFSPSGDTLAAAGDDGLIRLYSWDDLDAPPKMLRGHRRGVMSVAFSPTADPPLLASCSADRTVKLWDVKTAKPIRTLVGHTAEVWSVAFSSQGNRLVTASEDFTARVWGVDSGEEYQRFRRHHEPVFCARFSPDGKWVASGGYDKRILIWRADRFEPVEATLVKQVTERLRGESNADLGDREVRQLIGHTASIRDLQFSSDGRQIVSAARDNTLRIWEGCSDLDETGTANQLRGPHDGQGDTSGLLKTLRGHGGWVSGCALLETGVIVSGAYDHKVRLWRPQQYAEIELLESVQRPVLAGTYSPDGRQVALALDDGSAGIWDAVSGKRLGRLEEGHDFLATSGLFLPGGDRLATIAGDDTLRLWDVRNGTEIWKVEGTGRRGLLALSPDGTVLVTGSSDGKVGQIWDVASGERVRTLDTGLLQQLIGQYPNAPRRELEKQVPDITAISCSPNGRFIATADTAGTCRLWRLDQDEPVRSFRGHDRAVSGLQWMPDSQVLLTASADGTVAFWDVGSGKEVPGQRLLHEDAVSLLAVAEDGTAALSVAADRAGEQHLHYWDLTARRLLARYPGTAEQTPGKPSPKPQRLSINSVAFSPDEKKALVATFDSSRSRDQIQMWDLESGEFGSVNERDLRAGLVFSAVYARAAAHRILTVGGSGARFWDQQESRELMSYQPHGAILSVDYSPSGQRIVTTGSDRSIKIWRRGEDAEKWISEVKLIGEHVGPIKVAKFRPHGEDTLIVSGGDDSRVILWRWTQADGWQAWRVLEGHTGAINALGLSPDGRRAASAAADGAIRLWDLETGAAQAEWKGHRGAVLSVAFSADARRLISGGSDNRAIIWDVASGDAMPPLVGHSAAINAVAFSPDGWRALTGSQDNTIKLWDSSPYAQTDGDASTELLSLSAHQREVTAVQFSPDGGQLLSAARDRHAFLWNSVAVEPAIMLRQSRLSFRAGDPAIALFTNAELKYPSIREFDGWLIKVQLADAPDQFAEQVSLDANRLAEFGLSLTGDVIRIAGGAADDVNEPSARVAKIVDSEQPAALALAIGPAATPEEIETVIRSVDYHCALTGAKNLEPLSRVLTISLFRPGTDEPMSTSTVTVQLTDEDAS